MVLVKAFDLSQTHQQLFRKDYHTDMIKCNLKEILRKRNVTAQELHDFTKTPLSTISNLRNNKAQSISFQTISNICGFLSIAPEELFSYNDMDYIPNVTKVYAKINYEQIDSTHDLLSISGLKGILKVTMIDSGQINIGEPEFQWECGENIE